MKTTFSLIAVTAFITIYYSAFITFFQIFWSWGLSDRIAAIASCASFLQVLALILTIGVMRNTARSQLKAYVFANAGKRKGSHALKLEFEIYVNNFGQTPGYHGFSESSIGIDEYPPIDRAPPQTVKSTPEYLEFPPSSGFWHITDAIEITQAESDKIKDEKAAIYISGVISYKDVFAQSRTTRYRLMYTKTSMFDGELLYCKYGNKSD